MKFRTHISRHWLTYIFLLVMASFVLTPLVVIFSQSLMTSQQVNRFPPPLIPETPTMDAYVAAFTRPDLQLMVWLGNSLYAATAYTVAVLIICVPAAYAFARLRFPGRNLLFGLLLLTIL